MYLSFPKVKWLRIKVRLPTYGQTFLQTKSKVQGIPGPLWGLIICYDSKNSLRTVLRVTVGQGKGTDHNQPKEEMHRAGSRRVPVQSFCVVFHSVRMYYPPGIHEWQYTKSIANQEAHPCFDVQSCYWGFITQVWFIDCPQGWIPSSSQLMLCVTQRPHSQHKVGLSGMASPEPNTVGYGQPYPKIQSGQLPPYNCWCGWQHFKEGHSY